MRLLDDKYEFEKWEVTCDCGERQYHEFPGIKGLITIRKCPHCGKGIIITDTVSETRQGLHQKTIALYNAVTLETDNYQHGRMTLRHLFYRLVSNGVISKTEKDYNELIRNVSNMRKTGLISYDLFADGSRLFRKPRTYSGMHEALEQMQKYYRKSLWAECPVHIQFWIEKHAISDIIFEITSTYDVPLFSARGFSSLTYLHDAAREIIDLGKPCYVYHIGDYDPSGIAAAKAIEETFLKFGADIIFERLSVTREQIKEYNLPTRPTKKSNHSKDFNGQSVEVDAMPPHILQGIVEYAILKHIDQGELERMRVIEEAEKATLKEYTKNFSG